jgi:hypothetical protein
MEALFNLKKADESNVSNESRIKQAEQIWSMLDDMAISSPDSYKFANKIKSI